MDTLSWLQDWYRRHCNGTWEHSWGVQIGTLDNPGWRVVIDLRATELFEKAFEKVIIERSVLDWIQCFVKEGKFEAACGPENLEETILIFRAFADSTQIICRAAP